MKKSIRQRYPHTRSSISRRAGIRAVLDEIPADYVSKSGRVRRWKEAPLVDDEWAIVGRGSRAKIKNLCNVRGREVCLVQCIGTHGQMREVWHMAMRCWMDLPAGEEFKHLFTIMFPKEIQLEAEETIDRTKV